MIKIHSIHFDSDKKLEEFIIEEEKENDPRWDELKKLMNDN